MSPGCSKDNPGWDRDHIDQVIASGERVDVKLTQPVNVYWVYVTAWATPDGIVQFRPDVYQRDGAGPGPLASAIPLQPLRCRRNNSARADSPSKNGLAS